MAWEIYPQGLADVLLRVHWDYAQLAILITENGAAFEDQWNGRGHIPDKRRTRYLRDHIAVVGDAVKQGFRCADILSGRFWISMNGQMATASGLALSTLITPHRVAS